MAGNTEANFHLVFHGDDSQKHKSISSTVLLERWKKKIVEETKENGHEQGNVALRYLFNPLSTPAAQEPRRSSGLMPISLTRENEEEEDDENYSDEDHDVENYDGEREKKTKKNNGKVQTVTNIKVLQISLGDIRKIIALSPKSFFCLNETSHLVEEETTLEEYIALTSQTLPKEAQTEKTARVTIYYTNRTTRSNKDDRLSRKEAIAKQLALVQDLSKTSTYTDPEMTATLGELSSLYTKDLLNSSDYATTSGSSDFLHPEQMTGKDWDNVMRANRLLHGIYSSSTSPDVQRARKPVFRRKLQGDEKKDQNESFIPSFSICDKSNISVDESASEHKKSLLDFGFNGGSAELSVSGGGPFVSASASVSGSGYKAEKTQEADASAVKDITISYKFPRVELYLDELDQEGWELTQECTKALDKIKKDKKPEDVYNFYETFGKVFAVTVRLGGRLTSTHHIEKSEEDKISEVKNKMRAAAAISVSGPVAAGSFKGSVEHQNENNNKSSDVSNKDTLAWEATGGDTTLASNPAAWAPTLKDHHNWRVTEITKAVPITQILDTMGSTCYGSLFQDIEYPPLVSMGKPHFKTPPVAIVPDVQSVLTLYYQDSHGTIWECTSDGTSDTTGEQRSVTMAMRNSPLVALNNPYDKTLNYIRIIFVNPHGYLDELIYDTPSKEYIPGHLSKLNIKLPRGNHIAATSWGQGKDAEVRLFYQDGDSLCHLIYRPGQSQKSWYKPPVPLLRDIVPKSPLAAGYQKGTWDHARGVPFVFVLRKGYRHPTKGLYPLYVLWEDTGYQNHWSVKEVTNSQFAVRVKLAVPNALANDLMKSYYWLKQNDLDGDSPWGCVDIQSLDTRPEGVSIAVVPQSAQVYFISKGVQGHLHLYRKNSDDSFTELMDKNGDLLLA